MTATPPDVPDWTQSSLSGAVLLYEGPPPPPRGSITVTGVPTWVRAIALVGAVTSEVTVGVEGSTSTATYGTATLSPTEPLAIVPVMGVIDNAVVLSTADVLGTATLYVLALPDPAGVVVTNTPSDPALVGVPAGQALPVFPQGGYLKVAVTVPAGATAELLPAPAAGKANRLHSFSSESLQVGGSATLRLIVDSIATATINPYRPTVLLGGMLTDTAVSGGNGNGSAPSIFAVTYDVVPAINT